MRTRGKGSRLCLPEKHTNFAPIEEYEVLRLVGDIGAETAADNAVPRRIIHRVELGLDYLCDVI